MNPKNKLYLTSEDFPQYQDEIGKQLDAEDRINGVERTPFKLSETEDDMRTKNITFVVTERCNLDCTYCYETHKTGRRMTKEIAKEAVDCILDAERMKGYYDAEFSNSVIIEFIGGEPLLEIDLIDYICEYFKAQVIRLNHPWRSHYMFNLTTNGVLYRTKKVQDYLKKNQGHVSVGITIDGNKRLHDACRLFPDGSGSYDIVEDAVKDWIKYDDHSQTKITLSPENVMYVNEALANVFDIGVKGAFTNCVFEEGWELEHARILYDQMIDLADWMIEEEQYDKHYCSLFDESIGHEATETRNWCGGNGSMLAIAPDGKLFSCIRFMKYSLNNQPEKPIGDIWNGADSQDPFLKCMRCITMQTQCRHEDNKKCLTCPIASGCALCTGYNYDRFGDPDHKATFICDMHRARVLANVYYWNKLYQHLGLEKSFELNLDDETALRIVTAEELKDLKGMVKHYDE